MRRLLRKIAAEITLEFLELIRFDGHLTFKLVSDKDHLFDIAGKPLLLNLGPLLLLRICTTLVEEHPTNTQKQQEVDPADVEGELYRTLPAWSVVIRFFCHILL